MNASTSLIPLVEANPALVLIDTEKFDRFYEEMKRETDAHVPDLTTDKGRKAIAALAYKVARTKTAIDDAGKKLNEEARAKITLVDEARRGIREKLDALKDEVRRPLTEWEAAEKARGERCQAVIDRLKTAAVVTMDDTSGTVAARLAEVSGVSVVEADFTEWFAIAEAARQNALTVLEAAGARLLKEEADRAELERLRAEAAERQAREQAEREAAETAEREAAAAKAEEERQVRLRAEEEARVTAAAEEAEARARAAAEQRARAEQEERDRAHAEALAAERRRADEAEAAQRADAERIAAEEERRQSEQRQLAAENARREANRAHRGKVMGEAKAALMKAAKLTEDQARIAVLAISGGNIPHITIKF